MQPINKVRNAETIHGKYRMTINIDCFKAYDIRGRIPDQLNTDIVSEC
jgi:hypothetical protein